METFLELVNQSPPGKWSLKRRARKQTGPILSTTQSTWGSQEQNEQLLNHKSNTLTTTLPRHTMIGKNLIIIITIRTSINNINSKYFQRIQHL